VHGLRAARLCRVKCVQGDERTSNSVATVTVVTINKTRICARTSYCIAATMYALRRSFPIVASSARTFTTTAQRPLAKMQLIGRLAAPAEEVATSTGRNLVRYALGVSTGPRDEDGNRGVSWFKIASFADGPQKELLLSLPKGSVSSL
jgi:hypothetical protein